MASPRTLLFAQLFRAIKSCEPTTHQSIRARPSQLYGAKRSLTASAGRRQETYPQRYGPAAGTSLPPPEKPPEPLTLNTDPAAQENKSGQVVTKDGGKDVADAENATEETVYIKSDDPVDVEAKETTDAPEQIVEEEANPTKELDMVLSIPSPSEMKSDTHRHPHLEASPYEHHFDTYSLVQQLAKEGCFNEDQSITIMKAVRLMLAINLDLAKEGLVSKSDVENETYLFRAACSELRTTLQAGRHNETQHQRSTRAQLQHEFDILNQKTTQDLASMREELKGMFNDRKLSLQEEKRKIDGSIQELNYKITVTLNSDSKGEVEGLRWVLTRRAAMAIVIAACKYHANETISLPPLPPESLHVSKTDPQTTRSHDPSLAELLLNPTPRARRGRQETQGRAESGAGEAG